MIPKSFLKSLSHLVHRVPDIFPGPIDVADARIVLEAAVRYTGESAAERSALRVPVVMISSISSSSCAKDCCGNATSAGTARAHSRPACHLWVVVMRFSPERFSSPSPCFYRHLECHVGLVPPNVFPESVGSAFLMLCVRYTDTLVNIQEYYVAVKSGRRGGRRTGIKKAAPEGAAFLNKILAVSYSHMGRPHTTIGAITFHY